MNKIGVCEWSLPIEGPAACGFAAKLGFDGIQLDIGPYERGFSKSRRVVQDLYLEAAAEAGITFPSMATRVSDYYSLYAVEGSPDYGIVRRGVLHAIEACEYMNIPLILIPTFEKSYIDSDEKFDKAVALFQEACREAYGSGITIAAENTLSVEKSRELVNQVDAVNFGIYFDFQNYYLANRDYTPDVLEALYDHVVELHVKDGKGDDLSGAILGDGDVNFFESMKVLRRKGYDGWIVSENYYDMPPLCREGEDPVALIEKDLAIIRSEIM